MDNIYKYLNDIETDFSEYEEERLSPEEVSKIYSRVNKKLNLRKKNYNKAITWIGRAAMITLCCLAVSGGVYAATVLRQNNADNLRIKSSQSETIFEESNNVTKKIFDEETGSELTYDVYTEGSTLADTASLERISKQDGLITMEVKIDLEDISKVEPLRETLDYLIEQRSWAFRNGETYDNFSLSSKLGDTEMDTWLNNYKITENSLLMEVAINTESTKALVTGTDPDYPVIEYDPKIGPDSVSEEDRKKEEEYCKNYYASLPDPLNSPISINLFLGEDLGGTYTFETKLEGNFENGENARYDIDGGSATIEWYGQKESISIDSYSIEANGLQLYGDISKEDDWDAYEAEVEKQDVFSYEEYLMIRAWDDLGNNYLLLVEPGVYVAFDSETGSECYDFDRFTATLCNRGGDLSWYKEESGIDYCYEWADGISQITFAIEKYTCTEDGQTREVTTTHELVSDPVTIDLN